MAYARVGPSFRLLIALLAGLPWAASCVSVVPRGGRDAAAPVGEAGPFSEAGPADSAVADVGGTNVDVQSGSDVVLVYGHTEFEQSRTSAENDLIGTAKPSEVPRV